MILLIIEQLNVFYAPITAGLSTCHLSVAETLPVTESVACDCDMQHKNLINFNSFRESQKVVQFPK